MAHGKKAPTWFEFKARGSDKAIKVGSPAEGARITQRLYPDLLIRTRTFKGRSHR